MFEIDQHTHTIYSRHSDPRMTVANSLAYASKAGIKRLVVLEHVPEISAERGTIELWKKGRNDRWMLDQIASDLEPLRAQYPQMTILRGVEVDADPFSMDGSAMLDDFSGIDVVVGSTHIFPGGEAFWYEKVQLPPNIGMKVALRWRTWVEKFIRSKRIHILAHPGDLIGARTLTPPFDHPEMIEFFDPVLTAMKECNVAFEINELLGNKMPRPWRLTYPLVVQRAKKFGLKFSICSDAHNPDQLGRYNWAKELIASAGITEAEIFIAQPTSK